MSTLIAIDPGPTESAFVWLDEQGLLLDKGIHTNSAMEATIGQLALDAHPGYLFIEKVEGFGMAVGKSVFETVYWSGRFAAVWDAGACRRAERIGRKPIKRHLCGQDRAKDANIRQALIDRYGGIEGKPKAIGRKASPGPLYGVRSHEWAALALAVTALDLMQTKAA